MWTRTSADAFRTVRGRSANLMSQGHFQLGVHYLKPHQGRIVFVWGAMRAWLAGHGHGPE